MFFCIITFESRKIKILDMRNMSTTSNVIQIPSNVESGGKIDYLKTKIMSKKLWIEY